MTNLFDIGFNKGQQYETIITTKNKDNTPNAAPIGVICRGQNNIMCRIFKGSKTLENILETKEFTVNILQNPLMFTQATLFTIDNEHLEKDNSIKYCDSYFKCNVDNLIDAVKRSDPINKSKAIVIKATVDKIIVNNPDKKPFNRSLGLLIEILNNYAYFNDNPQYYANRLKEAKRVITKVGSKEEKKAINLIKEELQNKGFII